MPTLLASAGSLAALSECITKFYGGEKKELLPVGPNLWVPAHFGTLEHCQGVIVRKHKGRFRFEMK